MQIDGTWNSRILLGGFPGETTYSVPANGTSVSIKEGSSYSGKWVYYDSTAASMAAASEIQVSYVINVTTITQNSDNSIRIVGNIQISDVRRTTANSPNNSTLNVAISGTSNQYVDGNENIRNSIWQSGTWGMNELGRAPNFPSGGVAVPFDFTVAPGGKTGNIWLYYYNNIFYSELDDHFGIGISFINNLPINYIPKARLINGVWESCDRVGGNLSVLHGTSWKLQKTHDGHVSTDQEPKILLGSTWYNQWCVGKNAQYGQSH